jgi:hypothetical protein
MKKPEKEPKTIIKTPLFVVYGTERETPNAFTRFGDAVEELKKAIIEACKFLKK